MTRPLPSTSISPALDRDEPLDLLAADRLRAGDETAACTALAPLLAVDPAALAADDRAALVTHLTACARCRAVGVDVWLDGQVAPPAVVAIAPLPSMRQLARGSRRRRALVAGAAVAACLGAAVVVTTWSARGRAPAAPAEAPGAGSGSHGPSTPGGAVADPRPWARGVSADDQQAALALFNAGNADMNAGRVAAAAVQYRAALARWDHPAIAYNIALTLLEQDDPVELRRALTKAMRFGAAPLDDEKYRRAQAMLAEVDERVTHVEFATTRAGAVLIIDDREVFTGPGRFDDVVRAGRHTWTVRVGARSLPARAIVLDGGGRAALPDVDGELGP